jgi:hypothetical protein
MDMRSWFPSNRNPENRCTRTHNDGLITCYRQRRTAQGRYGNNAAAGSWRLVYSPPGEGASTFGQQYWPVREYAMDDADRFERYCCGAPPEALTEEQRAAIVDEKSMDPKSW